MLSGQEQLLYFAYGSNMAPQRLKARVPSAEPVEAMADPDRQRHARELAIYAAVSGSPRE